MRSPFVARLDRGSKAVWRFSPKFLKRLFAGLFKSDSFGFLVFRLHPLLAGFGCCFDFSCLGRLHLSASETFPSAMQELIPVGILPNQCGNFQPLLVFLTIFSLVIVALSPGG